MRFRLVMFSCTRVGKPFTFTVSAALPPLSALVVGLLIATSGCRTEARSHYTFEPMPRPVIAQAGFVPSRWGRPGADWVSSPTMQVLAVVGQGDGARLAVFNSEDGGDTFGKPVWVSEEGATVTSHGESAPAFFVTEDDMFAVWNERRELRFARSLSWGSSFQKPITITDKTGNSFSGYPSIGVAPDRDVYVVWIDTRDQAGNSDDNYAVYLAKSTDHGASFGKNVRVAGKICPCCRPTLSFGPRGEVMVFWRHIYPGPIHDMSVAISTDGGNTFSEPKRVAEDNWKIDGCPDSGPAVARVGNRVYVAWLTEASPEISGVRLTWSDDGGKSWAPAVKPSQKILDANYPWFSVTQDGRALLVFQGRDPQKRSGWSGVGVYLVEIAPDGKLSKPEAVPGLTSSANRPTVTAGLGGRVYVTWTGETNGQPSVYLSRARREAR